MKKLFCILILTLAARSAFSGSLENPDPMEYQALLKTEVCQTLTIKITRLADSSIFPKVEIPLCVAFPSASVESCVFRHAPPPPPDSDPHGGKGGVSCKLTNNQDKVAKITTPAYTFFANIEEHLAHAGGACYPDYYLTMRGEQALKLTDVWTYRFSNIVNRHKHLLPLTFSSIILPSFDDAEPRQVRQETTKTEGVSVQLKGLFDKSVQAIGYDEAGQEYSIRIEPLNLTIH